MSKRVSILLVFILGAGLFSLVAPEGGRTRVLMKDYLFSAELADTLPEREKGLGGRDTLGKNESMLFVFDSASPICFWMKDMRFNIDIIWLDEAKKVTYIQHNADPLSYPKSFCSVEPAKYVMEVNAGTAAQLDLKLGESISF